MGDPRRHQVEQATVRRQDLCVISRQCGNRCIIDVRNEPWCRIEERIVALVDALKELRRKLVLRHRRAPSYILLKLREVMLSEFSAIIRTWQGEATMKIQRDRRSGEWLLTTGTTELYRGWRSPWDAPSILRDALAREGDLKTAAPRAAEPRRKR